MKQKRVQCCCFTRDMEASELKRLWALNSFIKLLVLLESIWIQTFSCCLYETLCKGLLFLADGNSTQKSE